MIHIIISLLRRFFITGWYYQLWYFVGLIVASSILYLLVNSEKFSDKKIVIITLGLYFIGVLGNAYKNLLMDIPILGSFIKIYLKFFTTTKNGIFCGVFFITAGYMIKKYNIKIKNIRYGIYVLLFWVIYNLEAFVASIVSKQGEQDLLFSTPLITALLFLLICFVNIPIRYLHYGKYLRKLSVLIFGLHMLIDFYIELFLDKVLKIKVNSLQIYGSVVITTLIVSFTIIYLSKFKRFKWLRRMY